MITTVPVATDTLALAAALPGPGGTMLPVNAYCLRGVEPTPVGTGLSPLGEQFRAALWKLVDPADRRLRGPGPGFAMLERDGLRLLLNTPGGGGEAGQALPDGTRPAPGGWNRFRIESTTSTRPRCGGAVRTCLATPSPARVVSRSCCATRRAIWSSCSSPSTGEAPPTSADNARAPPTSAEKVLGVAHIAVVPADRPVTG